MVSGDVIFRPHEGIRRGLTSFYIGTSAIILLACIFHLVMVGSMFRGSNSLSSQYIWLLQQIYVIIGNVESFTNQQSAISMGDNYKLLLA